MKRPTIQDLAERAGVSVATVNRVLASKGNVRRSTMTRVEEAAAEIGFYGFSAIRSRVAAARPKYRFGFILHQPHRVWYQALGRSLALAASEISECDVEVRTEYLEDLSPQNIASRMRALAERNDAIGVVAAVHPVVSQTVDDLRRDGHPVFGLISQLSATGQTPYVGLDNWKVGRTAAWVFEHVCKEPGKLGILVGNHRYRCQDMNEAGFRSYFREHAPAFTLLEPLSTFESSAVSQEMTEGLLRDHADLAGLFVAGGGITGALEALRSSGRAGKIVVVGYELTDVTRAALLDGTLTVAISHPLDRLARETLARMIQAAGKDGSVVNQTAIVPFDLFTRENI